MLTLRVGGDDYELVAFGLGAGLVKNLVQLEYWLEKSLATEVCFGGITLKYRIGNTGTTFYYDVATKRSINAVNLANEGWEGSYRVQIADIVALAKKYSKKVRLNINAYGAEEYFRIVRELMGELVACNGLAWIIIEINLSCPNMMDGGHRHPVIAYNPELVGRIVCGVYAFVEGLATIAYKFAPYDGTDEGEAQIRGQVAKQLLRQTGAYSGTVELVLGNTIGGRSMNDPDGNPALSVPGNIGGQAGAELIPRVHDNLDYFSAIEPGRFVLCALGGVSNGQHVIDCLQRGAQKVFMTSEPAFYDTGAFDTVMADLAPYVIGY